MTYIILTLRKLEKINQLPFCDKSNKHKGTNQKSFIYFEQYLKIMSEIIKLL